MPFESGQTILFVGDSITDCGRDPLGEPTQWGTRAGLGAGYVGLVHAWISSSNPQNSVRVINRGFSGRTVRELKANWSAEVLAQKPDWLSVFIGVNDVWRQFDGPTRSEIQVSLAEYSETLDELLAVTRPQLTGLVLVTPFMIEPNPKEPMRAKMDLYGAEVKRLAKKHDAILVDVQAAFDRVCAHRHPMELSWDRIHPATFGHMIIARAWLEAAGEI